MQMVSNLWKDNQNRTFTNESFVEVSLDIADSDALVDASPENNGDTYISDTPQILKDIDKSIIPYCTLEKNLWILDGSHKIIPISNYGDCGYIGDVLSSQSGNFTNKIPRITINFTKAHSNLIPGVTIVWGSAYNEFAKEFVVTAYNGNTVVAKKEVRGNNSVKSIVMVDIINYDRITVDVLKWCLPYHRVRIEQIFVGMRKVYSKNELIKFIHSQTVDPISASLPKTEVSFSIDNTDNSYNPNNKNGLAKYLMERQAVKTRYGYRVNGKEIEWIKGGTFYLSEWDAPQNGKTAEFTARDLLEYMSATYYKGVYNSSGVTLYDLANQLLLSANLPLNNDGSVKWILDEQLKTFTTVAPLPIDTIANNLQLIANVARCVFYQDRNGILRIESAKNEKSDYSINLTNSYSKSDMTLSKPLKQIDISVYQYFDGGNEEIYRGDLYIQGTSEIVLTYSEMAKNIEATISGGTLESAEYYSNACKLKITGQGNVGVVLKGDLIKTSKTDISIANESVGETITVDNPLITSIEEAQSVGEWVKDYLKNRITLKSSWRVDPRLDALDIVENKNEFNTNSVRMINVKFTYNGAFKGTGEGRVI